MVCIKLVGDDLSRLSRCMSHGCGCSRWRPEFRLSSPRWSSVVGATTHRKSSGPSPSVILGVWWGCATAVRERVASPLRTLANLLEAMREGDYSIRARWRSRRRRIGRRDAAGERDGATLRAQRLGALEATTLLRKVMEEIDVAVFAFDGERRLKSGESRGRAAAAAPAERIMNANAEALGLAEFLEGDRNPEPSSARFPSAPAAGPFTARCFAKADCRTNYWWSPI